MKRYLALFVIAVAAVVAVPTRTAHAQSYQGCYYDDGSRALDAWLGDNHTVESCIAAARSAGHAYAGLQWYGQCFGGSAPGYWQTAASECNTPCSAAPSQICGGSWRNSIYATGSAGPAPTYCLKNGTYQSCSGLTCGVSACYDQNWSWMTCPADLTDSCQSATWCLKDGTYQSCSGLTCGVSACYDQNWGWMTCPADLTDSCQTATWCLKNGTYQSCSGLTCGVSACYDQNWGWMTCPAELTDTCQTATWCLKDGTYQSCSGLTCGVSACYDQNWGWMTCPAELTDTCQTATWCLKNGSYQSCSGLTCGVTGCYDQNWWAMTCPADLTDTCQTATWCLKDGSYQSCAGQTCGVTACYDQNWGGMTCPTDLTDTCPLSYEGYLDVVTCSQVAGWVWSPSLPNTPLTVEVLEGGVVIATTEANQYRADVHAAGKGNGWHAFSYALPTRTGTRNLGVRVNGTTYHLYGSPRDVTCAAVAAAEPLCGGGTATAASLPSVSQMVCDVGVANDQLAIRFLGQWFAVNWSGADFSVANNVAASSIYATPSDSTQTVYADTGYVQTRQEQLERQAASGTPNTVHQRRTYNVSVGGRTYNVVAEQVVYDTRYGIAGDGLEIAGDLVFQVTMNDPSGGTWTVTVNPRRAQLNDSVGAEGDQTAAESLESWSGEQLGSPGALFTQRDVRYLPEVELGSAVKVAGSGQTEFSVGANPAVGAALEQLVQTGPYQSFSEAGAVTATGGLDSLTSTETSDTVLADLHRATQFYLDSRNGAGFTNPGYDQPLLSLSPINWKFRHTLFEHTQRWPFLAGLCGLEVHARSYMDGAMQNSRACFDGRYVFANLTGHLQIGLTAGGGFGCGVPFIASASAGLQGRVVGRVDVASTVASNQLTAAVRLYSEVSYDAYFSTRVLFWRKSWEKRLGTLVRFNREYQHTVGADVASNTCPTIETNCQDGGDDDGDGLSDGSDSDCYAPQSQPTVNSELNQQRNALLQKLTDRQRMGGNNDISNCTVWRSWTQDQREVFATMTDRLYQARLSTTGRSVLSHLDDLYAVKGRDGSSCGGGEYNRAFFSMDDTLAIAVRQIAQRRADAPTISDVLSGVGTWRGSCDPNAHIPFANGANFGSLDTHRGGTTTNPCPILGHSDAYPSGQIHFFPDPTAARANQPIGRPGLDRTLVDPNALEMDHDYDLFHNSATQCYSRGGAPCGPLSFFGLCKKNLDNYRTTFNRDVMAFVPTGC
jgi:hypothetical protein